MIHHGLIDTAYIGGYVGGSVLAFSFDPSTGTVAAVVGGVFVGIGLGLPRAMPAIQAMLNAYLDFKAKLHEKSIEATVREHKAELEWKLEQDAKLSGTYIQQVEELRELLEQQAKDRAEEAKERAILQAELEAERRRRVDSDKIVQDLLVTIRDKADKAVTTSEHNANAISKIAKKVAADRVLVVEDDKASRLTLLRLLSGKGYATLQASTVEEAKLWLRDPAVQETLTFVLLDIMLPGDPRGGIDILEKIKRLKLKALVVVMTALEDEEILDEARRSFADMVVRKPIANFDELHDAMQALKTKAPRPSATDVDLAVINRPASGEIPTVP